MTISTFMRLKASLIRTPLQKPATFFAAFLRLPHRLRHPELKGLFEEPNFFELAIRKLNSTDSNCIDIGCHIGSVLSVFVEIAPKGSHIAFEPVPGKAALLIKNFPTCKSIRLPYRMKQAKRNSMRTYLDQAIVA